MAIIRGTTPTLTFHVKNEQLDLNDIAEVWITFKTKAGVKPREKTYSIDDVVIDNAEHNIELDLSQEDTLYFLDSTVQVQVRARFNDDLAYASSITDVDVGRILKEGVI